MYSPWNVFMVLIQLVKPLLDRVLSTKLDILAKFPWLSNISYIFIWATWRHSKCSTVSHELSQGFKSMDQCKKDVIPVR